MTPTPTFYNHNGFSTRRAVLKKDRLGNFALKQQRRYNAAAWANNAARTLRVYLASMKTKGFNREDAMKELERNAR